MPASTVQYLVFREGLARAGNARKLALILHASVGDVTTWAAGDQLAPTAVFNALMTFISCCNSSPPEWHEQRRPVADELPSNATSGNTCPVSIGDCMRRDLKWLTRDDDRRINMVEDKEVQYWCEKLGVSPEHLKRIVSTVGPLVRHVRDHLHLMN